MKKLVLVLLFPFAVNAQYTEGEIQKKFKNQDSINITKTERVDLYTELKTTCHYVENRIDPISNKRSIITDPYNLHNIGVEYGLLNMTLYKQGIEKWLRIESNIDLGCVVPYKRNRSKTIIKLKDGSLVNFFHAGDVDCGEYNLIARLTPSDISKLKKSPIAMIRIEGVKNFQDFEKIAWHTFFIDKLNCID